MTTQANPTDTFTTKSGKVLTFTFFAHSTMAIDFDGRRIYTDPVAGFLGDPAALPKADAMLIGHHHYDHFEAEAVEALRGADCRILCDVTTASMLPEGWAVALHPGDSDSVVGAEVVTLPAYNTSEGHTDFHPQSRGDIGFVVDFDGVRVYIAGDGEPTDEMMALRDIDIAFLPVNQPYTMTEQQASAVLHAIRPRVFYPYHYGQVDHRTDLALLSRLVSDIEGLEVRIRPME
ncbi:MAG: MBL fold metallo-hydrolase [Rikenellaceae bacterium]|nr:MBL fold metallo-hydrolase [Rikenellaceae bacterium]